MTESNFWEMNDKELAKISPAMMLGRQMMSSGMSFEDSVEMLRNTPGVEVRDGLPGLEDPSPDPNYHDRPDHPHFRMLSRIIQQMDAESDANLALPEEQRSVVESLMPLGVDEQSVIYMAQARARRAEELLSKERSFYAKAAVLWLDAFTAGVKFGREQAVQIALDEGIEGSRRFGRAQ